MPSEPLRFRDIRGTSAFRLTVVLGGVFAVGLLALIGLVYLMTARELIRRNDSIMQAQVNWLLKAPAATLPVWISNEIAQGKGFAHIALISSDGERIAGDMDVEHVPKTGHPIELQSQFGLIRLVSARTVNGETIVVARDVSQIAYLRGRILLILLSSGVVILLGLTSASVLLAMRPIRRVRDLEQAAREIARGRLDTRMPISGQGDELDQIAGTVNLMVDEIGRVMAQVKGVTEAVAHDLRTPLAHVRGHLLTLSRQPGAGVQAERAIEELDLVLARFAALLRIAEIEAGARRAHFAAVDLSALAAEAIELYEPLAEERGLSLSLTASSEATIQGDRHLLLEAISNLLDNAIKFGRSRVELSVTREPDGITFAIRDDGPGIPVGERKAALHRFHRGTNAQDVPGSGLGLSIVAAVSHLHGQSLRLDHALPGLIVTLHTPSQVKFI